MRRGGPRAEREGRRRDPEGEDGVCAIGLRFEGVGVEGGTVIFNVEVVQPIQVVVHEAGTEADGPPFFETIIYLPSMCAKRFAGGVELAVVIEIVDADFEAVRREP